MKRLAVAVVGALGAIMAALIQSGQPDPPSAEVAANRIHGDGNNVGSQISISNSPHTTVELFGSQADAGSSFARSLLVGTWKGIAAFAVPNIPMRIEGLTQLMEKGEYNFAGDIFIQDSKPESPVIISSVRGAGHWHPTSSSGYVLVLEDLKQVKTILRAVGKPDLDVSELALATSANLAALFPKGTSQQFAVQRLDEKHLVASGQDLYGVRVEYTATKQQ